MAPFRDGFRFTRLAAGIAFLILAGFLLPLLGPTAAGAAAVAGVGCLLAALLRRRDPYDLKRLWDEPAAGEGDPLDPPDDYIPAGESALPYCGWCDEAAPRGSPRCPTCNRPL